MENVADPEATIIIRVSCPGNNKTTPRVLSRTAESQLF
jgi:hypothetical protein